MSVRNFPIGTYVQSNEKISNPFIGHVVGLTVNHSGEPILEIKMTCRRIKDMDSRGMYQLGWEPAPGQHEAERAEFWQRTSPMHPSNVNLLERNTFL
jgi:hypothetical protein